MRRYHFFIVEIIAESVNLIQISKDVYIYIFLNVNIYASVNDYLFKCIYLVCYVIFRFYCLTCSAMSNLNLADFTTPAGKKISSRRLNNHLARQSRHLTGPSKRYLKDYFFANLIGIYSTITCRQLGMISARHLFYDNL